MKLFENEWQDYAEEVLPQNCPYALRRQLQLAFYAGAFSVLNVITDEDVAESVIEELGQFFEEVKAGLASH